MDHALIPSCAAAQKLSKVKATDKLSIPLKLDMASILAMAGAQPLQTGTYEDAQYELMSILVHKGPSASHGHYGALRISSIVAFGQWILASTVMLTGHRMMLSTMTLGVPRCCKIVMRLEYCGQELMSQASGITSVTCLSLT